MIQKAIYKNCAKKLFYNLKHVHFNDQINKNNWDHSDMQSSTHVAHHCIQSCFLFSLTVTPHVTLMSKLPVVDALQGHPFDGHLPDARGSIRITAYLHMFLELLLLNGKEIETGGYQTKMSFFCSANTSFESSLSIYNQHTLTHTYTRVSKHTHEHTHKRTHTHTNIIELRRAKQHSGLEHSLTLWLDLKANSIDYSVGGWEAETMSACVCLVLGGGDNTTIVCTDTNHDGRTRKWVRGDKSGFPETRGF